MKKTNGISRGMPWLMSIGLSGLVAACGGGGQSPILGAGSIEPVIPPTVTLGTPLLNATGVALNTKVITASFSKPMDPATLTASSFSLACAGATAYPGGIVTYVAASQIATLTLPVSTLLPANTKCDATVTKAAKDTLGLALEENYVWNFSTAGISDITAPTVTNTVNANGASNVAINTKVGATFSEAMDPLSINSTSVTVKQGNTSVPGTVTYSGVSMVFTPAGNLAPSTTYTITVSTGAKDLAGNSLASNYVWIWTTGAALDTTPPTVTNTTIANGASNVAVNSNVAATFSEAMDPLTISNTSFTLKQGANIVPGIVVYSGVSMVFVPTSILAPGTTYTATVNTGAKDIAGNSLAKDYTWSWTTNVAADTTPPTVTNTINSNGASNVAVNSKVGATFSEAMNPLTITNTSFTLKQGENSVPGTIVYSGVSVAFVPASNLAANTTYTALINTGATDLAGNAMVDDYTWSWSTGQAADTTRPRVTDTINADGATNVAVNTRVGGTFSEALNPLSVTDVNVSLRQTVSGAAVAGTTIYSGTDVVFAPLASLQAGTQYTATIKGGATGIKDLADNAMAADFTWSWTTAAAADTIAPLITTTSPSDLAQNAPVSSAVNATFNEAMDPLTVNTANFKVAGVTGVVTFNALTKVATFTPNTALTAGTTYSATVTRGAHDLAGNALATDKIWTFTTAAVPVVIVAIPLNSVGTFGTFGGTAGMTNMGTLTQVNGDIGTTGTEATMVTGFHDTSGDIYTETGSNKGSVNGKIYSCTNSTTGPTSAGVNAPACAIATQARLDAQTAYQALVAKPVGGASPAPGANLAGLTLLAGTYVAPGGSFMIQGGNLTLDAKGDANATWVFQMPTTLTVGGPGAAFPQNIILAGGAQAKNVYWQVGSFATINAGGGGTMVGTIIAQAGVSFSTAGNVNIVTLNGRALSLGASVTLVNTVINVPAQ